MRREERTTLKDVATHVGVSISTVSRVVRGDRSRPVEVSVEGRILEAVRTLGYRPNLVARALVGGGDGPITPAREVGVILGARSYKYSDPFFSRVIEGIDAEIMAGRRHIRFIYSLSDLDDDGLFGEMVRPDVVGGLIGIALGAGVLARLKETGVAPIVVVEGPEPVRDVDFVSCDKEGAMAALMEHLWGLGRRHVAYLGAPGEERARRVRAWLALADAPPPVLLDTHEGWDMEAGYAATRRALVAGDIGCAGAPTAIVAGCDALAVGALRAAREAGLVTPRDLALVGFDDTMGAFAHPPLTTVSVQREQLGRLAVRRLVERQRHPEEPAVRIVEATELIVRESCGARSTVD
jgi:LacI family transcriptional regulator